MTSLTDEYTIFYTSIFMRVLLTVGPPSVGPGLSPDNNNDSTAVLAHDAIEVVDLTRLSSRWVLIGFAKQSSLQVRFDGQ